MNKKIWLSVFGLVILMFPAVVGAKTCYDGNGILVDPCPGYVDVTHTGSTTDVSIEGTWLWINGNNYVFDNNKFFEGGVQAGTYSPTGVTRQYALNWNVGYHDVLTLSIDGLNLNGTNQYGQTVTATRVGAAANSPCAASLNQSLVLHIPYLKYAVANWGTQYLAVDFVYNPFLLNLLSGINFKLNAYSIVSTPSCTAIPELKYDDVSDLLVIYIPDVVLPGGAHIWVELRYDELNSTVTQAYFYVNLFAYP